MTNKEKKKKREFYFLSIIGHFCCSPPLYILSYTPVIDAVTCSLCRRLEI